MTPNISVIVPVYNAENYLVQCIDSILLQEYEPFELILINDGSKDSSAEICNAYASRDTRVVVRHQENSGVSKARNLGIEIARGTYLMFVDSDDFISENLLSDLFSSISRDNADLCISSLTFYYNAEHAETMHSPVSTLMRMDEFISTGLFLRMYERHLLSGPTNKLFRTKLIRESEIRFQSEYSICEDGIFVYSYLEKCRTVSGTPLSTYFYRQTRGEEHLLAQYNENAFSAQSEFYRSIKRFLEINGSALESFPVIHSDFFHGYLNFLKRIYLSGEETIEAARIKATSSLRDQTFLKVVDHTRLKSCGWFGAFVKFAVKLRSANLITFGLRLKYGRHLVNGDK